MNPINLLLNYFIANNRANYYSISDQQKVQNTALLSGIISNNPVISYLLIENEAKNLQVKSAEPIVRDTPVLDQTTTPVENVETKDTESSEILLSIQEEIKNLDTKINEAVTKAIDARLQKHLLISDDPETKKLADRLDSELRELGNSSDIQKIEKIKADITAIAKHRNLVNASEEDKKQISRLKKLISKGNLIDQISEALHKTDGASVSFFSLTFQIILLQNVIMDLRNRLDSLEPEPQKTVE